MPKNSVGIYISPNNVDIVELEGSGRSPVVVSAIRENITSASIRGATGGDAAEMPYEDSIVAVIKSGMEKLAQKPDSVFTVLSPSDVMIRNFSLPKLPASEYAQAVNFEARKYIPFSIEDVSTDFKLSPTSKEQTTRNIFLIAATKERIDFHINIFKKAQTDVLGIDIIPFCILRMLLLSKKVSENEHIGVIYIDSDKKSIAIHIMQMGMPFLSRDLTITSDDKEAFLERLTSELRVSLDYQRRQKVGKNVSKIIICGEDIMTGLDKHIADDTKMVTEVVNILPALKSKEPLSPSYIIAAGAALGGLATSKYSVNFSPLAAIQKKKKLTFFVAVEAAAALGILVLIFLLNSLWLFGVSANLKGIEKTRLKAAAAVTDRQLQESDNASLKKIKNRRLQEIKFLELALKKRASWTIKLNKITEFLPAGLWLEKITAKMKFTNKKLGYPTMIASDFSLTGAAFLSDGAKENRGITKFFSTLRKDKDFMRGFNEIEPGAIKKEDMMGHSFSTFSIYTYSAGISPERRGKIRAGAKWKRRLF